MRVGVINIFAKGVLNRVDRRPMTIGCDLHSIVEP